MPKKQGRPQERGEGGRTPSHPPMAQRPAGYREGLGEYGDRVDKGGGESQGGLHDHPFVPIGHRSKVTG